ncbi:pescadillo-like [Centruroides sculpturatus]|uniref:pescadillo-like n=1 Tax=Centruroides sculpturatus TaxID=218467 RepID=UPI000C6E9A4A|nr:pescadillo-like [Centruroides sculpturatus]
MAKKVKKKGEAGAATAYLSRKQALKKLQLSLKDFRRLCILKGVYPVEPRHKKKVNHGSSANKTYYLLKDIQFLAHEPVINKFREFKVFMRKLKKAYSKDDKDAVKRIKENEPIYKLDHIVKERYPTFVDALRDVDDALSMCFLFATFPKLRNLKLELLQLCKRLTVEFLHYVRESRSLRKVFISIKGYYYQAEIMDQLITWVVPHPLGFKHPVAIDFKIMVTFAEFYTTMLGFVNYKLYHSLNLVYPPKLETFHSSQDLIGDDDPEAEYIAALSGSLKSMVKEVEEEIPLDNFMIEDEDKMKKAREKQEETKKLQNMFNGLKVFISREVPRESLVFVIRSFGGMVSWDKNTFVGATYDETDQTITHQIVDRPEITDQYMNRYYVQPQWIYDCVNARMLLPESRYFPGVTLPPHLSPFVEEKEGEYIPPEKQEILNMRKNLPTDEKLNIEASESESEDEEEEEEEVEGEDDDDESENESEDEKQETEVGVLKKRKLENKSKNKSEKKSKMEVQRGEIKIEDKTKVRQREEAEEKRLRVMMIPKKHKRLYNKIVFGEKRRKREAGKLKEKREIYEKEQKKAKKKKKLISPV